MNSNNKIKKIFSAYGILLLIILLLPVSYAAYTSVTAARRVISTASSSEYLFSSNYLLLLQTDDENQEHYSIIPVDYQQNTAAQAVYVSICNYAQGYISKWSEKDINYSIHLTLVDLENYDVINNDKIYTRKDGTTVSGADILEKNFSFAKGVSPSSGINFSSNGYVLENEKLQSKATGVSQNIYTIIMNTSYADIVGVKVETIADNDSPAYADYKLGGILALSSYAVKQASNWQGKLLEAEDGKQSSEYMGFNYEVSGTGIGKVKISWDNNRFSISKFFKADINEYITESTDNSLTFEVGKDGQDDRFIIQFYRAVQAENSESWSDIQSRIECVFTPDVNE